MPKPKALTIKRLEEDKAGFETLLVEQKRILAETEATILRLEGARIYVGNTIERLQKERSPEEVKDAPASGEPNP